MNLNPRFIPRKSTFETGTTGNSGKSGHFLQIVVADEKCELLKWTLVETYRGLTVFFSIIAISLLFVADGNAKLKDEWAKQCEKYRDELTAIQKADFEKRTEFAKSELAASEKNLIELNAGRGVGGPGGRKNGISMKGQPKKFRDLAIKDQKKEIEKLKAELKNGENDHKAELTKIAFETPHLGRTTGRSIDAGVIKVGDLGTLPGSFKSLQVIDANNVIITWFDKTYWLEMSTKGMVDGEKYDLPKGGFVQVLATKQYKTIDGASRTVFHFKSVK